MEQETKSWLYFGQFFAKWQDVYIGFS